jgi:hypothetical protein
MAFGNEEEADAAWRLLVELARLKGRTKGRTE